MARRKAEPRQGLALRCVRFRQRRCTAAALTADRLPNIVAVTRLRPPLLAAIERRVGNLQDALARGWRSPVGTRSSPHSPKLAVTATLFVVGEGGLGDRGAQLARRLRAPVGSRFQAGTTANSSPPMRATQSMPRRKSFCSRAPNWRRIWSPPAWPSVSLMPLNRSMSHRMSDSGRP